MCYKGNRKQIDFLNKKKYYVSSSYVNVNFKLKEKKTITAR